MTDRTLFVVIDQRRAEGLLSLLNLKADRQQVFNNMKA